MRLFIKEVPFPFQALLAVTAIWAERHRFQAFDSNFFLAIETQSEIALADSLQCSFDASEQRVLLCGLLEQQFLGQVSHRALAKVFGGVLSHSASFALDANEGVQNIRTLTIEPFLQSIEFLLVHC